MVCWIWIIPISLSGTYHQVTAFQYPAYCSGYPLYFLPHHRPSADCPKRLSSVDGVLDMDYSNIYEDNSEEDAETSTDATIAECQNAGEVKGDINVSGIAGTMAIEYDFDLESDVTGIEDARLNSTFQTKSL